MRMDLKPGLSFENLSFTISEGHAGRGFLHCPSRISSASCSWHMPDQGFTKFTTCMLYEKEKADALKLWHEKLKQIVGGKLVL